jgi:NAD(P)-dependent dehydrogenase (short-subunit alcohol dehydrogenase family)
VVEPQAVAVITGGSPGIGTAMAASYGDAGYAVVATASSIQTSDEPGHPERTRR